MKQHITPGDLNRLSEESNQILREWWEGREYFKYKYEPLLSIGQMIEFLGTQWMTKIVHASARNGHLYDINDIEELCDALWSACKEVLNK